MNLASFSRFLQKYKLICKTRVEALAFKYLIDKKNNRKVFNEIKYDCLEMTKYLQEAYLGYLGY